MDGVFEVKIVELRSSATSIGDGKVGVKFEFNLSVFKYIVSNLIEVVLLVGNEFVWLMVLVWKSFFGLFLYFDDNKS